MRTPALAGLVLAIVLLHLAGWWIAAGDGARRVSPRAGVRWISLAGARADGASAARAARVPEEPAVPRSDAAKAPRPGPAHAVAKTTSSRPAGAGARPRTYPTRAPPSLDLHYALAQSSGRDGTADIAWSHDDTGFALRVAAMPASGVAREWVSAGGFDAAGLAPGRLVERERGRDRREVDFDQAVRAVRFSASPRALPIAPGTQDRWSWLAQLAAIAEAAPRPVAPGTLWRLQVAGLRGELDEWVFRVLPDEGPPPELEPACQRACGLLHLLREPERPYGMRVEAWLAHRLHHFPVKLRLSTPPSDWVFTLRIRDPT